MCFAQAMKRSTLSEVQWSEPDSRDFNGFLRRLDRLENHYTLNGYNFSRRRE
jgi:hypothetical protein